MGFEFGGRYTEVDPRQRIRCALGDDREVLVWFRAVGSRTCVVETFVSETELPAEHQRAGWQAILDDDERVADRAA